MKQTNCWQKCFTWLTILIAVNCQAVSISPNSPLAAIVTTNPLTNFNQTGILSR